MNWDAFKTYGLGYPDAFETLNNQLFERYIQREYGTEVIRLRTVNGSGGDGGVEAYAVLKNGKSIAIQSKWFRQAMADSEIRKIRSSILTAMKLRPEITEYIICIPHDVNTKRIGPGNKPTKNDEETRINALIDEIKSLFPDLTLVWWFEAELLSELQLADNIWIHRYWFEKEVISLDSLKEKFQLQLKGEWLKERYVPDLNSLGFIHKQYEKLTLAAKYREELVASIDKTINKVAHCSTLIDEYLETNEYPADVPAELKAIQNNLWEFVEAFSAMQNACITGDIKFHPKSVTEVKIWPVTLKLERKDPTHRQKPIQSELIRVLRDIHSIHLENHFSYFKNELIHSITLVRGGAGAGKTQGLTSCTEIHLKNNLPAILFPAMGTPCNNWTEILSHSTGLTGWTTDQIFTALEALAIRQDVSKARQLKDGEMLEEPPSCVLISVDALEEDTARENDWCSRINETTFYVAKYPRLRFLFSARDYFKHNCIDAYDPLWRDVRLPDDGDVPVDRVLEKYLKAYRITLENGFMLQGLDSLLAIRLFCEQYQGQTISSTTEIRTATQALLRLKVEKINAEFISSLHERKSDIHQPVVDALLVVSKSFYSTAEIEHTQLRDLLSAQVDKVFNQAELDLLLDFLVRHGMLIRFSRQDDPSMLSKTRHYYRITYQSIIEHILSDSIYHDIVNKNLSSIPPILHKGMIRAKWVSEDLFAVPANQQIIQTIVNRLFAEHEKLIGDSDFLVAGFDKDQILLMRLTALSQSSQRAALRYEPEVRRLFLAGGESQYVMLKYLVLPSCNRPNSAFGAEYIHGLLIDQPSAFERDKLWSGLDRFEQTGSGEKEFNNVLKDVFEPYEMSSLYLSEFEDFNQQPLLYGWALSTIDQKLRNSLRIALAGWALLRPNEFTKLLDKLFGCNDPQIQEDLASIALGVASYLEEPSSLKNLAKWAIKNIFKNKLVHRNVIVRQGFRSVVEKAFMKKVISSKEVLLARPAKLDTIELLPLHFPYQGNTQGEAYPIVHDLAWYVIKRAYDNFLEPPMSMGDKMKDNDCAEASSLLALYREKYKSELYAYTWTMAAALYYIKNDLGLTRTKGNWMTQQSHGSKSAFFTYEEKYTWLAVHYIQGYLSDYIPFVDDGRADRSEWVKDLSKISDIPNPGEEARTFERLVNKERITSSWIIKEDLAPTIDLTCDIDENISAWVNSEPNLDFGNWLRYSDKDFGKKENNKRWTALYHFTSLRDASKAGYCHFLGTACLIKKTDLKKLLQLIEACADNALYFTRHMDKMSASPDTGSYSNPSDIVWMDWIDESGSFETVYFKGKSFKVYYGITEVMQGSVEGEKHVSIPSKLVRKLMGIRTFYDMRLKDENNNTISFIHRKSEGAYNDSQEIVVVDQALLKQELEKKGWEIVWFVSLFRQKNPLNESLKDHPGIQKSRKYFLWEEKGTLRSKKFWDEYFSNERDAQRKQRK